MFQTASLYSIEVDYYHYGTCEITDGSYFCGDHSCNTFKHVSSKIGGPVFERRADLFTPTGVYDRAGAISPLYTHGTANTNGNRGTDGIVANNPPVVTDGTVGLTNPHGYPLRNDAQGAQYHIHDGKRMPAMQMRDLVPGQYTTLREIAWHGRETLVLGQCKAKCDFDPTCKAFQENRWQFLHTTIKCRTFHFSGWVNENPAIVPALQDADWDFFEKYTEPKNPAWAHAPISTAFSPTTHGAGGMAARATSSHANGRRLEGVY